jgi:hypothetical protein
MLSFLLDFLLQLFHDVMSRVPNGKEFRHRLASGSWWGCTKSRNNNKKYGFPNPRL